LVRAAFEDGPFAVEATKFDFRRYDPISWSLTVDGRTIKSLPMVCSASTPRAGIKEGLLRDDSEDLEGNIALLRISTLHESLAIEKLAERGAIGVVAFQEEGAHLVGRARYPTSSIPCVTVPPTVGMKLWQAANRSGQAAELHVKARSATGVGTNLLALPRDKTPGALMVAHRDSRPFSPGAVDNASGTSMLVHLAESFPHPGFALLSSDAEEYGLLGARAFVGSHPFGGAKPDVFNIDSVGSGPLSLVERSRAGPLSRNLLARLQSAARRTGSPLGRISTIRGSDSDEFLKAGHQASWIRSYPTPTATTVDDLVSKIDSVVLNECASLLEALVSVP